MRTKEMIMIENAPEVEGLTFRKYLGEEDLPAMHAVIEGSREADKEDYTETLQDMENQYKHLVNCDPNEDIIIVEIDGDVVGYGRFWWRLEDNTIDGKEYIYSSFANLLPEYRGYGIRKAMLEWQEAALQKYIGSHPDDVSKSFQGWSSDATEEYNAILKDLGYEPVRYFIEMTRPIDTPLPVAPMPEGLEVRPALPEHIDQIWDADQEAFEDHFGFTPATEDDKKRWLSSRVFNPKLWTVAWEGDEVCGMILNFVDEKENEEFNRKRGYTEDISTRRPWRRRGLAKALLVKSIQMFKEMGMEETALGVDTINPSGAHKLYEDVGYKAYKRYSTWRKKIK